ncbi:MAG: hypothetical protein QXF12_02575 [Candidatus Aenigmatarchaeota archaeon]
MSNILKKSIDDIKSKSETTSNLILADVIFHTKEKDLDRKDNIVLTQISITKDYVNNMSDVIKANILIPVGTFVFDILPFLSNIEVTIIIKTNDEKLNFKERYKALFSLDENVKVNLRHLGKENLNQTLPPLSLNVQLLDRSIEPLRILYKPFAFDNKAFKQDKKDIKSILYSYYGYISNKVLVDNKPCIDIIDIEDLDNEEKIPRLVIPSSVKILDVPFYIQDKSYGMYLGDVGLYIQSFLLDDEIKKCLFIYSLYNPSKRYKTSEFKMEVYIPSISNQDFSTLNFYLDNKTLRVYTNPSSEADFKDDVKIMSQGSGYSMAHPKSMMRKPVLIEENRVKYRREKIITQMTYKKREDSLDFATYEGVSLNHYKKISDVLKRDGFYIDLTCNSLLPHILIPSHAIKIHKETMLDDKITVKNYYGCLHYVNITMDISSSEHILSRKNVSMRISTLLRVFVSEYKYDESSK